MEKLSNFGQENNFILNDKTDTYKEYQLKFKILVYDMGLDKINQLLKMNNRFLFI